jgi:tryptophan-rich sensory protein
MRQALDLSQPERRVGLSAHDFAQAACAKQTLLTRSEKDGGSPTTASRWLTRIGIIVEGAGLTEKFVNHDLVGIARRMDRPAAVSPLPGLLLWFGIVAIAAAAGAVASADAPTFYSALHQPAWAPPAALFGPVWTALYALMAIAAWLVWRPRSTAARPALTLFLLQLVLNALWSWLFFAWHRGAGAMLDLVLLWMLILATTIAFWRQRPLAGALLLPYLAWVSFAGVLNYWMWQANPGLLG